MAGNYNTFVFKKEVYPNINNFLDKNNKELIIYIKKYFDRNNSVLFNKGIHQLYFGTSSYPDDINIMYKCTGQDPEKIKEYITKSGQTDSHWMLFNKPINWIFVNCIKYFSDKRIKELDILVTYFACYMYSSIFFKYFKGYPVNDNIMDYTINNLSNRYDIKKLGNLFNVLMKISMKSHETYSNLLTDMKFSDRHIVDYMMNLHTRINNFVKELKNQYQKNKESGNYLNYEKDDNSEENFHENDNQSYSLEKLTNKVTTVIVTNNINYKIVESSAKMSGVSVMSVKSAITQIIDKESEEIREFILLFLQQYLIVEGHSLESIASRNYLTYSNKIYSKSNTNDKGVLRMKDLLDKWLEENSEAYVKTERVATKSGYRKSIHLYFSLSIQAVLTNKY